VFGRRIGDDFYPFDHICRNGAQSISPVTGQHGRFSIDEHLHSGGSPEQNLPFNIYRHGRYIVQHVQGASPGTAQVFSYVKNPLIQLKFRGGPLPLHNDFVHLLHILFQGDGPQVHRVVDHFKITYLPGDKAIKLISTKKLVLRVESNKLPSGRVVVPASISPEDLSKSLMVANSMGLRDLASTTFPVISISWEKAWTVPNTINRISESVYFI